MLRIFATVTVTSLNEVHTLKSNKNCDFINFSFLLSDVVSFVDIIITFDNENIFRLQRLVYLR